MSRELANRRRMLSRNPPRLVHCRGYRKGGRIPHILKYVKIILDFSMRLWITATSETIIISLCCVIMLVIYAKEEYQNNNIQCPSINRLHFPNRSNTQFPKAYSHSHIHRPKTVRVTDIPAWQPTGISDGQSVLTTWKCKQKQSVAHETARILLN